MDEKIVSACKTCKHRDDDKKECSVKCEKRLVPVKKIGPMVASMELSVKKLNKKPKNSLMEKLNDLDAAFKQKHTAKKVLNKNEEIPVDVIIEDICLEHGIDRKMLYLKNVKPKTLRPLRVNLAKALSAAGLKYKDIAKEIGCPTGAVSSYVNNYDYKTKAKNKQKGAVLDKKTTINEQGEQKDEHTSFGDEPEWRICDNEECQKKGVKQPIQEFKASTGNLYLTCNTCRSLVLNKLNEAPCPDKKRDPDQPEKKEIAIDFTDHPKLHEELLALSKERLRSPENQLIWILLKIREKGQMGTISE